MAKLKWKYNKHIMFHAADGRERRYVGATSAATGAWFLTFDDAMVLGIRTLTACKTIAQAIEDATAPKKARA